MARLPTAAELDLFDIDVPEGMAISVFPWAQEYTEDPMYYDPGGRDPIDQRKIFKMSAGKEQKDKLAKVLEDYPRYGPKFYEKAARAGRADMIRLLLELGASMDIDAAKAPRQQLDGSKHEGDEDNENDEDDEDDGVPSVDMQPALHVAAFEGHFDCVKILVEEANVDVNSLDSNDTMALTSAAVQGHKEIVEFLLGHNAIIVFDGRDGLITDTQAAMQSGSVDILKSFLDSAQAASHSARISPSEITYAAASGSPDMLKFALEHAGFSSSGTGKPDDLPEEQKKAILACLPYSTKANDLHSLQRLLSYLTPRLPNGSLEYYNALSESDHVHVFEALEDAMEDQHDPASVFDLVWETLLCPPASVLATDATARARKHDWLHRRLVSACTNGCLQTVKLLVEKYGADVNHISHKYFTTPLGRAAASGAKPLPGRLAVARYLLTETDVNIHLANGQYANGTTALALTVNEGQGQAEMVRLLLEHGGPVEQLSEGMAGLVTGMDTDTDNDNGQVEVYIMNSKDQPRAPVKLLSKDEWENLPAEKGRAHVKLEVSKDELSRWIAALQIRKRDMVLHAEDPKCRPLQDDTATDENLDNNGTAEIERVEDGLAQML